MKTNRQKKDNSVIVIIVFFGKLPWYYTYFLHSCEYNPDIHFLLIADHDITGRIPENVHFIKKSLPEVKALAEKQLECSIASDLKPFKFCDFRPAFGLIFREYIQDYAYWGHADMDVIFGNIRNFMTGDLLNDYDVISMRHDFITGWFTLYRNCRKINRLFLMSNDYKKVFASPQYFNFDETNFRFLDFFDSIPYQRIASEVESMTHLVKKLHDEQYIRAYFELHAMEWLTGNITWNRGQLIYKNEYEIILYHLKELKKKYHPERTPKKIPDIFHISQSRIYF